MQSTTEWIKLEQSGTINLVMYHSSIPFCVARKIAMDICIFLKFRKKSCKASDLKIQYKGLLDIDARYFDSIISAASDRFL